MNSEVQKLFEPLSADAPCGIDLENSQLLASFDAYRLFGSDVRLPAKTNWREIHDRANEGLAQSKDLRLLAHFSAAILHTHGLDEFCQTLDVADCWLRDYWDAVFPRIDEDALLRKNALSCLADRMAIVDSLRRAPVVSHPQFGTFSLRHIELASGQLPPTETDQDVPTKAQIDAALEDTAIDILQARDASVRGGLSATRNVSATMQSRSGFDSSPALEPLVATLTRIDRVLTEHLSRRNTGGEAPAVSEGSIGSIDTRAASGAVGNIKSRQDAILAIEAIAAYFRTNEPSSPVPLLLDRAKRLVSKSFLEVLEDIAPDSLEQVRTVGGIKADRS